MYTNSYFGDGNGAIIYSDFQCKGYEENVKDCDKQEYGSFTCSRDNVVGIICRDSELIQVCYYTIITLHVDCSQSDIRLVDGPTELEGTLQVCYYNTWGLVSDDGWSDDEAMVVCRQLNYNVSSKEHYINYQCACVFQYSGAIAVTGSRYGRPNRTVQLTNVVCINGSQPILDTCTKTLLTPREGTAYSDLAGHGVAGIRCVPTVTVTTQSAPQMNVSSGQFHSILLYAVIGAMFVISLFVVIRYFKMPTHVSDTFVFLV